MVIQLATIPFYFSTWEEYHTHVLYLGYVNGPTEGLVMSAVIMALSGIYGPQIWTNPAYQYLGSWVLGYIDSKTSLVDLMAYMMVAAIFGLHIPAWYIKY